MIAILKFADIQVEIVMSVLIMLFSISVILVVLKKNKTKFNKKEDAFEKEKNLLFKHYDYLIKYLNDMIILTDHEGNIKLANEKALNVYGYTPAEFYGLSGRILRPLELRNDFDALKKWVFNEEGTVYETIHIKKNGESFPVEISLRSFQIENNRFMQAIIRDISERKKIESELIKAKEKAEEVNRLKSNFLSNMSHELRTPLVGILGYAEMIINDTSDTQVKEKVGVIYRSGKKLNDTLNAILDLSNIESKKININYEEFNMGELIEESVILYKGIAEEKCLALNYSAGTNGLLVELDKKMFSKIINNLLSNAIRYTKEGEVKISTFCNNGRVKIEVEDTGIGIPEDKLDIIFKPFRQVSEGYNRSFEGTGLGLTITRMLVEMMDGLIHVESTLGEGSKFTVEFSVYADKQKNQTL